MLDRRTAGQPILRSFSGSSFVTHSATGDRLLRTATCVNHTDDLAIGRHLDNVPALKERMPATNRRDLDAQAAVLTSPVDAGDLASLARPGQVGARRVPGLKLADDRVIRLLAALLDPGTLVADWTSREVHTRLLARHRLTATDDRLGQVRDDRGTRRTRLLGPLLTRAVDPQSRHPTTTPSEVEAAFRQVEAALDHLCATLGRQPAA